MIQSIDLEKIADERVHQIIELLLQLEKENQKLREENQKLRGELFTFEVLEVNNSGSIINRNKKSARQKIEYLGNGIKLEMIYIPGGSFIMGSPEDEAKRNRRESPQHQVTLQPFYMSKYPITQNQYQAITGSNSSHFRGRNRPV